LIKGGVTMLDLFTLYNNLKKDGIIFCFSGPASQDIVEGVGEALKQKMERDDTSRSTARKVFSVFVEQIQNVIRYSAEEIIGHDEDGSELRYGVVIVGREKEKFYVLSGNYIEKGKEEQLAERLRALQKMNKDELKAYFREQRKKDLDMWDSDAGLGLIETARKSSEPIEFSITPVNDAYVFFSIKALI